MWEGLRRRLAAPETLVRRARVIGLRRARDLRSVERFCCFVGYPRSGHSLLGSMLNAHPQAVISHELDVLAHLDLDRRTLFGAILARDADFRRIGRLWEGYDYTIPGAWQDTYRQLRVIGDKKGGGTAYLLADEPELLERLRTRIGTELRVIHMTRNPFDMVATTARKEFGGDLTASTNYLLRFVEGVAVARRQLDDDEIFDVRHEDLLSDPTGTLEATCEFVGLEPMPEYLEACSAVVRPTVSRTRAGSAWSDEQRARIDELIGTTPGFSTYHFGS